MDITALAAEPQLIQIVLDNEKIVEKYKEPVTFWTYDRQPMETYMQLVSMVSDDGNIQDYNGMVMFVKDLILDKDGRKVFGGKKVVPMDITVEAVNKIVVMLGN